MKRVVVVLPFTPETATSGNAAVVAVGIEHVDDRLAHWAGHACRRLQVHPQARGGVYFHDHPALLFQGPADVLGYDVYAGDIQADYLGGVHGPGGHLGMDVFGHVDGGSAGAQVGVAADQDHGAAGRHRFGRVALLGQNGQRNGVQFDLAQHRGMMLAPARIGIDDIDQLGDSVISIADNVGRLAPRGCHDFSIHDQDAIILAGSEFFHEIHLLSSRAALYAAKTCSRVVRLVATPRP